VLLFASHFLYLWWESYDLYPFSRQRKQLFAIASKLLFEQSTWVLDHIFHLNHTTEGQTIWVLTNDNHWGFVGVSPGCTSLKQWIHWIFIMVLFPGPWRHKLWYIPLGIIVIHFVNLVRIVGLSVSLLHWSQHFHFLHTYIFKTFFYFMIFLLWVIWAEKFSLKNTKGEFKKSL
jgi:exosortase/archaeosortase family protein